MPWAGLVDLFLVLIGAIALIATLIALARHSHRGTKPALGPLLDLVSSSSLGPLDATRTNPDPATPSETVDNILGAYAEGNLTAVAAAKELIKQLDAQTLDRGLDMDKDLRAAVARELHTRGLA